MSRSTSDRTVSTANSGMPCAWAVIFARAGRRHPRHQRVHQRVHRRRIQRVQGQRGPVAAGAEPGPGLAQLRAGEHQHVHRQVPGPVDQVVQEIQQSRIGVLGVLHQQHHRCTRRQPLEEQPPPREQLLPAQRAPAIPRTRHAEQPAQPRPDIGPLLRVGDVPVQAGGQLDRRDLGWVFLGDAQPLPHHLRQRPERHPVPVGQAPAPVPPHRPRPARRCTSRNSQPSRDLPTPAGPDTSTSRGTRRSAAAWNSSRTVRSSASRPVSGASSPSTRCDPPTPARTRVARHNGCGSALPFSACSPASANPIALSASRCVAPSVSTCPGSAAACTRAAVFTASPATIPSCRRAEGDRHLPGHYPGPGRQPRHPRLCAQLRDRTHQIQRRAHRPLRIPLRGRPACPTPPSPRPR